jgi:hypothetical protein
MFNTDCSQSRTNFQGKVPMVSRHDIPTSGVPGRVPVDTTKSLVGCLITVERLWSVEVSETMNEY